MRLQHISRVEEDQGDPRLSTILKLIEGLGCSPNMLLTEPKASGAVDMVLSVLFDRLETLSSSEKSPLVEIIERYCIACEMQKSMSKTGRMLEGEE